MTNTEQHVGTSDISGRPQLSRKLGVASILVMVIAGASPLGVAIGNFPLMFITTNSAGAPVFYVIATLILVLFAVGFTTMTKYVHNAGAFYSYVQEGLGRFAGGGTAFVAIFSYLALLLGVLAYAGVAVRNLLEEQTGWSTPWWLWGALAAAIAGIVGYRNVELGAKVLGILLITETSIVVAVDIGIIVNGGGPDGLSLLPWSPAEAFGGEAIAPGLGLMFAFLGFVGFEATAVYRNEAKDPDRTIPRATYLAVITIGVLYAISSWLVANGLGINEASQKATDNQVNMFLDLGAQYVAPIMFDIIQVFLLTAVLAGLLAIHNVVTRYLFTLGERGTLPQRLATVHPKHSAPSFASLVTSAISFALFAFACLISLDPIAEVYTWTGGVGVIGVIGMMTLTVISVFVFFRRQRQRTSSETLFNTTVAPAIAIIFMAVVFYLVNVNLDLLIGGAVPALICQALMVAIFVAGGILEVRAQSSARRATEPNLSL